MAVPAVALIHENPGADHSNRCSEATEQMTKWMLATVIVGHSIVAVAGCAPSGTTPEAPPATPEVRAPLDGTNYQVYYLREGAVWNLDTRNGTDSAVVSNETGPTVVPAVRGRHFAAVRFSSESEALHLVGTNREITGSIHNGGAGTYSFAWSLDGARLAFGYRPNEAGSGIGGIWIVAGDGEPLPVGCSAANRVHAWKRDTGLLVGDAANVYTVSAQNCATLATLPRQGKQDFAFAANGSRLSFLRDSPQGAALYIANHDGSGAQRIADPQVRPRNARWAPDGSMVAFEIDSPRFANRSHVAVQDIANRRISFYDRESALGVPSEGNACWSPDSRRVLFDRVFDRSDGVQSYQTRQKVVKTGAVEAMVFEELRRDSVTQHDVCHWLDNEHILIASNEGYRVVNVDSRDDFVIGDVESVLVVNVYE